jgi:hypothetical protein
VISIGADRRRDAVLNCSTLMDHGHPNMEVSMVKTKLLTPVALLAVGLAVSGVVYTHRSQKATDMEQVPASGESTPAHSPSPLASIPAPLPETAIHLPVVQDSNRDAAPIPTSETPPLPQLAGESSATKIVAEDAASLDLPAPQPQTNAAPAPPVLRVGSSPQPAAPAPKESPVPTPFPPSVTVEPPNPVQRAPEPPLVPSTAVKTAPPDAPPPFDPLVDVPLLPTGGPPAPPPTPPACAWTFQVAIVKGRTMLEARIGDDVQFTISCDRLEMKTPAGSIQAEGDVKVKGTNIEGTCKKLILLWSDERVQLEGCVKLKCKQEGQNVDLTGEQLSIKLAVVETLPLPAPAE